MFTVRVSKDINSKLGTTADGELVNDPVISLWRMAMDYSGHSSKKVNPVFRKTFIKKSAKPVQLRYSPEKLSIFSPIAKRDLRNDELAGESVRATIPYNKMIRVVFTAKVALSAGYFIYGDSFVKNADYESLRKLMNCKKGDSLEPLGELPLAVACSLSATEDLDENKIISRAFPISTIQFKLYPDNRIRTTVAIGGKFLGSVTYQAEISRLPNSGEFEGGRLF